MPRLDAEIKARLLATFRIEAEEHLGVLSSNLLTLEGELEDEQAHELVDATFRDMHTLKGASRSVGLRDVERVCQAAEELLATLNRDRIVPGAALLARLEEGVRAIARLVNEEPPVVPLTELVERLERAAANPDAAGDEAVERAPVTTEPSDALPVRQPSEGAIRVSSAKLDALLRQAEDLLAIKLAADEWVADAEALTEAIRAARAQNGGNGGGAALDTDMRSLEAGGRAMIARLQRDRRMIAGAVDGVLAETRRARMTPASTMLDVFPLMVRDLAGNAGKEVDWVVGGADLEVDRHVLDAIKDPLIHLVRNAVDHGIEQPDERVAAGKPRRGRITASVQGLEGGRVEFLVEDDGRGIDTERVREAAQRARLLEPGAELPDDEAALELIFRSGLSTSFVVTDVSGRGLGLAIVEEQVERIGGKIDVVARPGQGVRVRLILPATISTFRGLPVRAGGQLFLLPVSAVEQVVRIDDGEAGAMLGRESYLLDGEQIAVAPLDALLGIEPDPEPAQHGSCAIVGVGDERVGIRVDEVLADREVMTKEFSPPLLRIRHVAGAGLLGSGRLVLILRPTDLIRGVRELAPAARDAAQRAPVRPATILVVDDALTTRAMERSMLELAGYQVEVAVDGLDAWTQLNAGEFDLVVSDVDMPRMNGFELTARIRADKRLGELPVILVTALEGREDKERGLEVGASAYVVKSSFERSNLLQTIRRLGVEPGRSPA